MNYLVKKNKYEKGDLIEFWTSSGVCNAGRVTAIIKVRKQVKNDDLLQVFKARGGKKFIYQIEKNMQTDRRYIVDSEIVGHWFFNKRPE